MDGLHWWWSTAPVPGAIAVAHLAGNAAAIDRALRDLTGREPPAPGAVAWRRLGEVDDGVVARVSPDCALVMPHGGTRIRERLDELLGALGARTPGHGDRDGRDAATWPEADGWVERRMLSTLARAASPRAVDLLAAQPARWRAAGVAGPAPGAGTPPDGRDRRLLRLVDPPRVVVTGPANAGKSTLLNALAGRGVAVVHDEPGTTRDAVAARIDLAGLVVDWFDTPGIRDGMHPVERAAADLAANALAAADLVVELTAPGLGWHALPTPCALRIRALNQADRADAGNCAERAGAALAVSARTGDGIPVLVAAVRDALVPPPELEDTRPWRFDPRLPAAPARAR